MLWKSYEVTGPWLIREWEKAMLNKHLLLKCGTVCCKVQDGGIGRNEVGW